MQRTRCYYFYDPAFPQVQQTRIREAAAARSKASTASTPSSARASNASRRNPSDMSVALAALDAVVRVQGPKGEREIPFADFHRLPGKTPNVETNLQPDELITAVDLPAMPFRGAFALFESARPRELRLRARQRGRDARPRRRMAKSRKRGSRSAESRTNHGARSKRRKR